MVIAISQSGETHDTLAGVREAMLRGASAIGICNVVGSTIARECGQGFTSTPAPKSAWPRRRHSRARSPCSALLAVHMGRLRGLSLAERNPATSTRWNGCPSRPAQILASEEQDRGDRRGVRQFPNFLYVGRLYEYPVALEGALKLKEISYIHAEGMPAAEIKHGPIALVEPADADGGPRRPVRDPAKMMSNVQEIRARAGGSSPSRAKAMRSCRGWPSARSSCPRRWTRWFRSWL